MTHSGHVKKLNKDGTKELQQMLAGAADESKPESNFEHGFAFGNGLETKGTGVDLGKL